MFNWLKGYSPKQIKKACQEFAHYLGRAAAAGWVAADRLLRGLPFATDEAKWITIHPNGKGYNNSGEKIKGTPLLIDDKTKTVVAGAGGKFNGQPLSAMSEGYDNQDQPSAALSLVTAPINAATLATNTTQLHALSASITENDAQGRVKWLKTVAPHVDTTGLNYLKPAETVHFLHGLEIMHHVFPGVLSNIKGITCITAKRDQYQKDLETYQQIRAQVEAEVRKDAATTARIKSEIHGAFMLNLNAALRGDNGAKLDELRYNSTRLTELKPVKAQLARIMRHRSLDQLSKTERSELAKVLIMAAQEIATQYEVYERLNSKGIQPPLAPAVDFTFVKKDNGGIGYAGAAFNAETKEMWVSQYCLGRNAKVDFDRFYRIDIRTGFHPHLKDTISSIAALSAHETAHCLDNMMRQEPNYYRSDSDPDIESDYNAYDAQYKRDNGSGNSKHQLKAPYALKDKREFFAEHLTEALTAPAPSPTALKVLALAKKLYKEHLRGRTYGRSN